jgi:thiamine biosynthesis lipoprotein
MKRLSLFFFILMIALFSGCTRSRTVQRTETIMGTQVTITVAADTVEAGRRAIDAGMAELKRLDSMMSLYKADSEIAKVNRAAGSKPVHVSPEMIEVVQQALRTAKFTHGAFDVTIGPLVVLWQMRLKEGSVPTDREIAGVLKLVDYRNVIVDPKTSTIFLRMKGMVLDVGGCAKGYAADRVRDLYRAQGITNAVIAVAGDIWALGTREDGTPWRVGVQHPREHDKVLTVLQLRNKYISTSGDYERFVIREKKRYHHILDPRTGKPAQGIISVTVIGDEGAVIDPLTTALFILGKDEGMRLVKDLGAEAIFVDEKGVVTASGGIELAE